MTFANFVDVLSSLRRSGAIADLWLIYLFRVLPFTLYASYKARSMPAACAQLLGLTATIVCAIGLLPPPFVLKLWLVGMALVYFVAITACLHVFAISTQPSTALKACVLPVVFVLCVIVPAKALPLVRASLAVIIAHGFELTLAAYSYCSGVWSARTRPKLEDALFFVLVTPEVVFPLHGKPCRAALARGLGRAILGAALMAALVAIREVIEIVRPPVQPAMLGAGTISGAITFVLLYANHSALAHMQIGLCRVIGYAAPERYHFPLAAVSPGDFWTRWNRYFASWLRCYVYPLMVRIIRNRGPRFVRFWFATLSSFLFLGVFHDLYWLVVEGKIVLSGTLGFLFWGFEICLWKPIETWLAGPRSPRRTFARELSRFAWLSAVCLSTWVFLS